MAEYLEQLHQVDAFDKVRKGKKEDSNNVETRDTGHRGETCRSSTLLVVDRCLDMYTVLRDPNTYLASLHESMVTEDFPKHLTSKVHGLTSSTLLPKVAKIKTSQCRTLFADLRDLNITAIPQVLENACVNIKSSFRPEKFQSEIAALRDFVQVVPAWQQYKEELEVHTKLFQSILDKRERNNSFQFASQDFVDWRRLEDVLLATKSLGESLRLLSLVYLNSSNWTTELYDKSIHLLTRRFCTPHVISSVQRMEKLFLLRRNREGIPHWMAERNSKTLFSSQTRFAQWVQGQKNQSQDAKCSFTQHEDDTTFSLLPSMLRASLAGLSKLNKFLDCIIPTISRNFNTNLEETNNESAMNVTILFLGGLSWKSSL